MASSRPEKHGWRRSRHSSPGPGEPATWRRTAACREYPSKGNRQPTWRNVSMNVGEMQRLLSLKAEQVPNHRFDDLYSLLCHRDWLRLAHAYVEQNAGSKTAGCDG